VNERRFPARTDLRAGGPPQQTDSLRGKGWFGQRAVQQVGRHLGRAIIDRSLRGLIQSGKHPLVARGSYKSQMGGNLAGGRSVGVQHAGGRAMCRISRIAAERHFQSVADDRVDEPRRVIFGQDFQPNEDCRQSCRLGHSYVGHCRCMAQCAANTQDSQRLRETQRRRLNAPHTGNHPEPDALKAANEQVRLINLSRMPVVELERAQKVGYVQWIATTGAPHRLAQSIIRPTDHRVDERANGAFAQQARAQNRLGFGTQCQQHRTRKRRGGGPKRNQQH
jgi:hypothetical protein